MLLPVSAILTLEDQVRLAEAFRDIAEFFRYMARDIARRVVDLGGIRFVVDDGSARPDRGFDVEHGRQNLVFHFDETQRLFRDGARFRSDGSDAVADEAYFVVEQIGVVRRGFGPCLSGGGMRHARHVLPSEDGVNAWQRTGRPGIDLADTRMSMRARQNLADQHAGERKVVRESRASGDQLDAFHFAEVFPYNRCVHVSYLPPRAAASTAATGFV